MFVFDVIKTDASLNLLSDFIWEKYGGMYLRNFQFYYDTLLGRRISH